LAAETRVKDDRHPVACWLVAPALVWAATGALAQPARMTFVTHPLAPYTVEENGAAAGPLPDVMRATCEAIKAQCKVEIYPWRRALKLAEDGYVDGIYVVSKLAERERSFYLSPPIVESAFGVYVHSASALKYQGPADLAGYTVGAYGPSAASTALDAVVRSEPTLTKIIEPDRLTMLRKLSRNHYGERGAAVIDVDLGEHLIRQEKIPDLRLAGIVGKTEFHIGLSKKRISEVQALEFNTALRQLIRGGRIREIADKYGVTPASAD